MYGVCNPHQLAIHTTQYCDGLLTCVFSYVMFIICLALYIVYRMTLPVYDRINEQTNQYSVPFQIHIVCINYVIYMVKELLEYSRLDRLNTLIMVHLSYNRHISTSKLLIST
jgi:hypothetical protein